MFFYTIVFSGCSGSVTGTTGSNKGELPSVIAGGKALNLVTYSRKLGETNLVKTKTPTVRILGTVQDEEVFLFSDTACKNQIISSKAVSETLDIQLPAQDDGGVIVYFNTSLISTCSVSPLKFTIDTSPPVQPTALQIVDPLLSTHYNSSPTLRVSGVNANDTVTLYFDSTCKILAGGSVAMMPFVDVRVFLTVPGEYSLYAMIEDAAGNLSSCSILNSKYVFDPNLDPLLLIEATPNGGTGGNTPTPTVNPGATATPMPPQVLPGTNINLTPVTFANKNNYKISLACPATATTVSYSIAGSALSGSATCINGLIAAAINTTTLSDQDYRVNFNTNLNQTFTGVLVVDKTPPTVTFDALASTVISSASTQVNLSGSCSEEGSPVTLTLGSFQTNISCSALRFAYNLNLSPFADGPLSLVLSQQDGVGNQGLATQSLTKDTQAPTAITVQGAPSNVSTVNTLNITVGGNEISHYKYLLGESSTINCSAITSVAAEYPVSASLTTSLGSYTSGTTLKLCVLGRDSQNNWMNPALAFTSTWLRQVDVEASITGLGSTSYPSPSTSTRTLTIGGLSVVAYKAKTLKNGVCSDVDFGVVAETNIATPFYMLVNKGDGGYRTCVLGKRADGVWQTTPSETSVLTIDTIGPAPVISSVAPNPTTLSPIPYVVAFNEIVTGFEAGDLQITNGTLSNFSGSGLVFTFDVTPASNGAVRVSMGANAVLDAAGNGSSPSNIVSRSFGAGFPTLTLSSVSLSRITASFQVLAHFSSSVTGFDSSDLILTNAFVTGFTGNGSDYTIDVLPLTDGLVEIAVGAEAATDGGGLGNLPSNTLARTYDTLQPTVTFSSAASNPTKSNPIVVQVDFNEIVTGLTSGDFIISNGTVASLLGSDAQYTLSITPTGHGNVTVSLPQNAVLDEVNLGNQASAVFERFFDVHSPTVNVTTVVSDPTNQSLIPVDIQFSEDVSGFTVADITVNNGSITTFTGSGKTFRIEVQPSSDGLVTVTIPSNIAVDVAGNQNLASSPLTLTYDSAGPVVTFSSPSAGSYINAANYRAFTVTGACSENTRSIEITGSLTGTGTCTAGNWNATLDFISVVQGSITLTARHRDLAGNYANPVQRAFILDSVKPNVAITSPAANTIMTTLDVANFTVSGTCSEDTKLVTIAGDALGSITCSSNTWSLPLDFSFATDGTVRITASQTDGAANTTTTTQYSFVRNTTGSAVTVSVDDILTEEFGMGKFTLNLSAPQAFDVSVNMDVEEDTALNETHYPTDHDFVRVTQTVTIPAGKSSVTVGVPIYSDTRTETNEDFWVRLTSPSVGSILKNLGRGTITKTSSADALGVKTKKGRLDAGRYHTCFVTIGNQAFCWGEGSSGQIGDNGNTKRFAPKAVNSGSYSMISAGGLHTCAANNLDGKWYCWGAGGNYQNGMGSNVATPYNYASWTATQISAGLYHTCYVESGGQVRCGGLNTNGQLGINNTTQGNFGTGVTGLSSGVVAVAAGDAHSCALLATGLIKCWGLNSAGQVGDSTNTQRLTPVDVVGLTGAIIISAGANHNCALINDGTVRCWGDNNYGQLGDGSTVAKNSPVPIAGLSGVIDISAGDFSTCATLEDGTVKCWGRNNFGQLGDGSTTDSLTPISTVNITGAVTTSVGGEHACSYTQSGQIWCWGRNDVGQIGDNSTTTRTSPVNINLINNGIEKMFLGYDAFYGIKADGSLWVMGSHNGGSSNGNCNSYLGDNSNGPRSSFYQISGSDVVTQVSGGNCTYCYSDNANNIKCWGGGNAGLGAGYVTTNIPTTTASVGGTILDFNIISPYLTCAVVRTASPADVVKCRGYNSEHLGDGVNYSSTSWIQAAGITNAVKVRSTYFWYSGAPHSTICALLSDGTIKCWGYATDGQVGDGANSTRTTPVLVNGITNAVDIDGTFSHFCAALADGTVKCWGSNSSGQLGDGTTTNRNSPVTAIGVTGAIKVGVSAHHSCALLSSGQIMCWGDNGSGQLGIGNSVNKIIPVGVPGISGAIGLSVTGYATCAQLKNKTIKCWGGNSLPLLKTSNLPANYPSQMEDKLSQPYPVDQFDFSRNVLKQAGGSEHQCVIMTDNHIKCWGKNASGQLGDGTSVDSVSSPIQPLVLTTAKDIAAGPYHTCAVTTTGALYCWGDNSFGQFGDGTKISKLTPTQIISSGVQSVFTNFSHTCAILTSGNVQCWGNNEYGQLGIGSTTDALIPQNVVGVSGVVSGAAGSAHSCVVTGSAQVSCWGLNDMGQIGNGSTTNVTVPTTVSGLLQAVKIFAAKKQTCSILTAGDLKCWGLNDLGQLGDGSYTNRTTPVTTISSTTPAKSVALNPQNTCVVMEDSSVRCWGINTDNILGTRSSSLKTADSSAASTVFNMAAGIKDIWANSNGKFCAHTQANGIKCWGVIGAN